MNNSNLPSLEAHRLMIALVSEVDTLFKRSSDLCDEYQSVNKDTNKKLPAVERSFLFPRVHRSSPTAFSIDWQYMIFFNKRKKQGDIRRVKVNPSGSYNIPDLKKHVPTSRVEFVISYEQQFVKIREAKKELVKAGRYIRHFHRLSDKFIDDPPSVVE